MKKEENREFIKKTESLVNPQDVTAISFLGDFNRMLPKKTQHRIMVRGSRKIPYMGFIVDPYCFFLAYRITDTIAAQAMLPDGYELADVAFFDGDDKVPMVVVSAFSARTSAFIGTRLEFYIIARSRETGKISWIIADYETDTNSHDPKNGFGGYTSNPTVFTTTPYGGLLVGFHGRQDRSFTIRADLNSGTKRNLDHALWVVGNMSVDYGGELRDETSENFSLIFDPFLMREAVSVPIGDVEMEANDYLGGIIDGTRPLTAAVFPYSQHFIIRQDLDSRELKDEEGLSEQIRTFLKRSGFKTMAGGDIKKPLYLGIAVSWFFNLALILFLVIRAFF